MSNKKEDKSSRVVALDDFYFLKHFQIHINIKTKIVKMDCELYIV